MPALLPCAVADLMLIFKFFIKYFKTEKYQKIMPLLAQVHGRDTPLKNVVED